MYFCTIAGRLRFRFKADGPIFSSPALSSLQLDTVYVGADDGNLYAVSLATGLLLWKYKVGNIVRSSPAVAIQDGTIIVATDSLHNHMHRYKTAHQHSAPSQPSQPTQTTTQPENVNGTATTTTRRRRLSLIPAITAMAIQTPSVTESPGIFALSSAGYLKWHYPLDSGASASPSVSSDGVVYIGNVELHSDIWNHVFKILCWLIVCRDG
jgi:outer membrane protein assembly factor BamB